MPAPIRDEVHALAVLNEINAKLAAIAAIEDLSSETPADIKNKVNEILAAARGE